MQTQVRILRNRRVFAKPCTEAFEGGRQIPRNDETATSISDYVARAQDSVALVRLKDLSIVDDSLPHGLFNL